MIRKLFTPMFFFISFSAHSGSIDALSGSSNQKTFSWSGPYAGLNLGYGWGDPKSLSGGEYLLPIIENTNPGPSGVLWSYTGPYMGGPLGGAQVGYKYQLPNSFVVVGAESDFQGSAMRGGASGLGTFDTTQTWFPYTQTSQTVDWFGTVRGIVGHEVMPRLLFYGTAGFAYGGASSLFNIVYTDKTIGRSGYAGTRNGWSAGGGIEWAFIQNFSAKIEYLHVDLGQSSQQTATLYCECGISPYMPIQRGLNYSFNTIRAGINYHFKLSDAVRFNY